MEYEESLETGALISQSSYSVHHRLYHLTSDRIMTTSVIVSGVFFSCDQLFRVIQLSVGAYPDFVCAMKWIINWRELKNKQILAIFFRTDRRLLVQDRPSQHVVPFFPNRSRWRMYWNSRCWPTVLCLKALFHPAEFRARDSTAPSTHYPFARPPGPHALIYIHAGRREKHVKNISDSIDIIWALLIGAQVDCINQLWSLRNWYANYDNSNSRSFCGPDASFNRLIDTSRAYGVGVIIILGFVTIDFQRENLVTKN